MLKELPGAEGLGRTGDLAAETPFVLLPCHRVDLARGEKQWCPLAVPVAGGGMRLALSAPWSHPPAAAITLCPRRGCLWATWLCQAVGQRGETQRPCRP